MNTIYIKSKAAEFLAWTLGVNTELQQRTSQQLNDLLHECEEQAHNPAASIRQAATVIKANCQAILDQRKVAVPSERSA